MWATVGMSAVLIPWGETIAALSSGAVSGVSTSAVSGVDGKFWEFLKILPCDQPSMVVGDRRDQQRRLEEDQPDHQKVIVELTKKLEPQFWDSAFQADKDSSKKIDSGMTRVTSRAMTAELRKRTAHLLADFMKRVPSSEAPIKAYRR